MSTSSNLLRIVFLYAAHCLIPATLLITTTKQSVVRYLSIPCSIFIVYRAIPVATALGPGFVWCECVRLFITIIFQCINLLLINPKDSNDLPSRGSQISVARIYAATRLFTDPRGINTPWQIKNAPPQPAYYKRRGMSTPPRDRFLVRQIAIVVWQYLVLDVFATLGLQQALEQEKSGMLPPVPQWDISTEQWIERIISNVMAGFVVSRILIDFHHRAFSIIIVGLGLDSPENCPPLYGRALDADTIRGFWAKFWHQLLQNPLTSVSAFITQDLLGLRPRSFLQRYMNVFVVFFCSGGLHFVLDIVQGIPAQESGAMLFFLTAPLGLMIEDGVKAIWGSFSKSNGQSQKNPKPLWQRALGLTWSMAWLGITSTGFFYPQVVRPQNQALVPLSVAGQIGLPIQAGIVLVSGAVLAKLFEVEV
ncbi:uncharacterized protein N7479_008795 [Penicillium vulpinum]|uniref:Wax synthase domain-containing protein n=1 Tax=Penicillium vulpinum TaxID=29845 RepID=A0A1V6S211_9EURO|nr:uncharacterized protein N7479_008795 [Penicillium vulpinum]KAJ5950382.1 hypothetical protein N7479_008795 [Penicillium vulpinum]OQE07779.1 hypothetical protein PENVUL_c012G01023 [Penicillium vulpinum]